MKKLFVNLAGFRGWFALQHYKGYKEKYKPFINIMEYDIPFEGAF